MKIGIFDSGRGGEYVAADLRQLLPNYDYLVVNDRIHVPYGSRPSAEIIALTDAAIQPLLKAKCQIIIIACNTATMAAIATLRKHYPHQQFIGIEPMIKPANVVSRSRHITLLATPLTIASKRLHFLIETYGKDLVIDTPQTAGWAAAIENSKEDTIAFDGVTESVAAGSDTIVLACTHYHVLRDRLQALFPDTTILEPTEAIAQQVARLAE